MPGHLFEGNPVDEGTTPRGTDTPVHCLENPAGSTHSSTSGLSPRKQLERQAEFYSSHKTSLTLLSQLCRDSAIGVRNGKEA